MTDREHRSSGRRHDRTDSHDDRRHDHAHTPGRSTLTQSLPPSAEPPHMTSARVPLDRPARTQLRMLIEQVRQTLRVLEAQSSVADREAALDAVEIGAELALEVVPNAQHTALVTELRARLGTDTVAQLSEELAGSDSRAAAMFGASAVRAHQDTTVQLDGDGNGLADSDVHSTATAGVGGGGSQLPHYDAIQSAFGGHDVSGVSAHVGGKAADAALTIGARAYAVGNSVAFSSAPDLHLAAHEAAHVVQQRGGVQLSGGVGRAGDPYEQHADAVADVVVRGGNAEPLLDQMAPRGAVGGGAVQRAVVQRDLRRIVGHYRGSNATMQLGQIGPTVVGTLEIHPRVGSGHARLLTYDLHAERAWSNDGSDGFRGNATRGGRALAVTIIASGEHQARVELSGSAYTMQRDSDRAVMPPSTLGAATPLDHAAETAPLTTRQRTDLDHLVVVARRELTAFFAQSLLVPATPASRMSNLGQISTAVTRLFSTVTPEQLELVRTVTRARLAAAPLHINDTTWDLLDWLYIAMAQSPNSDGPTVEPIHEHLQIPIGGGAIDGATRHRYRVSMDEAELEAEEIAGGSAFIGRVTVEYLGSEPAVPGERLWTRSYPMSRLRLEGGLEEGFGGGLHQTSAVVETPWPWQADDFVGPISGGGWEVGAQAQAGDDTEGPQVNDSILEFHGQGLYPALPVNFPNGRLWGLEGHAGGGISMEGGMVSGMVSPGMREAAADSRSPHTVYVPASTVVELAFGTNQATLSEAGLRALREVLAWNEAMLETGDTRITVDAFASRLDSEAHNLMLAQTRQHNVMAALLSMMPAAPVAAGEARGEAAATEAGVLDGDNARFWRRADIRIDGILVLQLYAPIPETTGSSGVVADPDHAD